MLSNLIIRKEVNKCRFALPFSLRLVAERSVQSTNSSPSSVLRSKQSNGNREKNLEQNPFYAKYAEKIAKVKQNSSETVKRIDAAIEDKEAIELKDRVKRMQTLYTNDPQKASDKWFSSKSLKEVVKLDLLMNHTADEIVDIWSKYHRDKANCVYAVIPTDKYEQIYKTSREFPLFIYPIPRPNADGTNAENDSHYEFMLGQFNGHEIYFTPLIMYQTHKENATPVMVIHHYPELQNSKNLVLMSGEYDSKMLNLLEAQCLSNQIQLYYAGEDIKKRLLLYKFNREPNCFSYIEVINEFQNSLVIK
ncbi:ATP synthase mitochondrial F1 complex assembly factor 1-like protein [Dinothrombium tinctorium]|uniref:ATP synthase mitochondrial F1 complex assembly factor 1-like protein n=1 Tax=Dinothrombium tinctorium TaxID=1965070 RepID=A0A3S3PG51_9ACAR|nr:ATP synthase mitochondrial F1 complex assembly factor 1-like protein [Dinothrombium tinctorium]RWS15568.1 ATP synthase mitochondrial F1 complex assembly factor 1-like protein [Dinothrombium tinctorium]